MAADSCKANITEKQGEGLLMQRRLHSTRALYGLRCQLDLRLGMNFHDGHFKVCKTVDGSHAHQAVIWQCNNK